MTKFRRPTAAIRQALGVLGVVAIASGAVLGFTVATSSAAASGFAPEPTSGNTYATQSGLSPKCPNALAGTPGSDPASKRLNAPLNNDASFTPGGTIHYVYDDNPNTPSVGFNLQDCIVTYPAGQFQASDFNPTTGELTNVSKSDLTSNATKVEGATLSGILDSTGHIYFNWTSPSTITPGVWVCNFARDISDGHGGGGNRKVSPICKQIKQPVTPTAPTHNVTTACGQQDQYTVPTTTGVTYKIGANPVAANTYNLAAGDSVTITAVPNSGYYFPANTVDSWTFTGSAVEPCDGPVTPAAPTHTTSTVCGVTDSYTIPSTDGVDYFVNGANTPTVAGVYPLAAGDVVTITAAAQHGSFIAEGADTSWEFTGSPVERCDTPVTPAAPTHATNTSCGGIDTYTIPSTTGVSYFVDNATTPATAGTFSLPAGTDVGITAAAQSGYVIADNAATSWLFTGSPVEVCSSSTPNPPAPTTTTTVAPTTTTTAAPVLALTADPEVTTTTAAPVLALTPAPAAAPAPAPAPQLPFTGYNMSTLWMALGMLSVGMLMVLVSRRKPAIEQ